MGYVPDNLDAFNAHQARQDAQLARLPKCEECGDPIQGEFLYDIGGVLYCEHCIEQCMKCTDDYEKER